MYASYGKLSKELTIASNFKYRPSSSCVIDQNDILNVLTHNLETAWPTKILMLFLSSLDNLLLYAYIIFQKGVDYFEIEHKTC